MVRDHMVVKENPDYKKIKTPKQKNKNNFGRNNVGGKENDKNKSNFKGFRNYCTHK